MGSYIQKTNPIVKDKARLLASDGGAQLQTKSCALDPRTLDLLPLIHNTFSDGGNIAEAGVILKPLTSQMSLTGKMACN